MCREPGWNDSLSSPEHADRSDPGIRNRDSSHGGLLVRINSELASGLPAGDKSHLQFPFAGSI
jgi:hypothetical protein